ncbi:hypothetical protein F8388_018737 [Cannabis sativa]|uniref:Uncharacterized protein n=1 Tax=Cannabis sativa TaxID=3483 RepID=A0A7J6GM38_CANSA|nr:hypothetical protein F8388_018737 [Cannabis sativa]
MSSSPILATLPMANPILLRGSPLLRLRLQLYHYRLSPSFISPPRWHLLSTAAIDSTRPEEKASSSTANSGSLHSVKDSPKYQRWNDADYRQWKNKEDEILKDISPIILLTKDILHSGMYMDGERLTPEDEKAVVERLLAYHPHAEDKIGCGLDSIMLLVDSPEAVEKKIQRLLMVPKKEERQKPMLEKKWESSPEKKKEETWLLVGSPRQRDVMETLSLIESPEKNDKEPLVVTSKKNQPLDMAHFTICNQEKGLHLRNMCFGPNLKRQRMTLRCLFPCTKKRPKVDRVVVEPSNMPVVVVALSTSWDLGKLTLVSEEVAMRMTLLEWLIDTPNSVIHGACLSLELMEHGSTSHIRSVFDNMLGLPCPIRTLIKEIRRVHSWKLVCLRSFHKCKSKDIKTHYLIMIQGHDDQ